MIVQNKRRRILDKVLVRKEEYDFVKDAICSNNRTALLILCTVFSLIFAVLSLLVFFDIGILRKDLPVFLGAFLCSLGVLIPVALSKKTDHKRIMFATYVVVAAAMIYGLIVSYRSPDQCSTTIIAMMGILAMTFVDRPIRMSITNALSMIACILLILFRKSEAVRTQDLVNLISCSVLSTIGGCFTMKMKIHGYAMDKLHEQDIAKGKKQLSAVEWEASQLLIAIKASYAMVVSVNLTQNTYKLIGDESFVTQGDDVTGNFDEVIGIHAKKVTDAYRQRYLDTFSRQALLSAYAAGKTEVYLEYQQCDDNGVPHWLGTHTMFTVGPGSTDVTEITISQNIDERVRKEAESKAVLKAERDNAERARKAKTDFLFQMSHDIRTPMNAIIGYANFIESSDDLYTIHNDYVQKLKTAGQQLLMLINDALEMSRIESGKLVFRREVQDIRTVITNTISVMKIQADEKGVALNTDIAVEHSTVNFDGNHMSRVIMNLLSNAVKFTPSGGSVTVSLHEKPRSPAGYTAFTLKVADTGIGMSPEFIKKAFEPFEREQTSTVSGMQGTGLGLSIVQRIVETAGDTISVESEQGKGTVFTLDITLLRAEQSDMQSHCETEQSISVEQMADYFKGKRVLLVEDNEFNLNIAQVLLENAGFTVETATDGRMAVNKVIAAPTSDYYDAILMDVQMPVMNGYAATKEIRALPDNRAKTVILAVTANAFDSDREDAFAAGMNGHVAKPIDVTELYKILLRML